MDEHLVEALAGIDRPGDVAAAGDRTPTIPGLKVEGIGAVGLPLSKAQARALSRRCRQAPYGKGSRSTGWRWRSAGTPATWWRSRSEPC